MKKRIKFTQILTGFGTNTAHHQEELNRKINERDGRRNILRENCCTQR